MGMKIIKTNLGKIELETPIILSSGVFGFGEEMPDLIDIKKITYKPLKGNVQPRIYETYSGMINSIGLQNPGVFYFIENILPKIKKKFKKIFVSITGKTEDEFIDLTKIISKEKVDAIELNLSCPNFEKNRKMISQDPDLTYKIVKIVKENTDLPVIAKLTPNVTDIKEIAISAQKGGADILCLINTLKGLRIDLKKMKIIDGGLSGPSIKPVGLKCVYEVYKVVNIPIIGTGGIFKGQDGIEYILAGANAIGIGSGFFNNINIIDEIIEKLLNFIKKGKFGKLDKIVGLLNEKKIST